jgi:RNA recognition motif-containing protein
MAKKLYVGNLPFQTTEAELNELFASVGEVSSVSLIIDRYSGRSKGFAFVEMVSDDAADAAISQYNGYDLNGRPMVVNEARPMEDRRPRFDGGNRGGSDRRDDRGGAPRRDRY